MTAKDGTEPQCWPSRGLLAIAALAVLAVGGIALAWWELSVATEAGFGSFRFSEETIAERIKSWGIWGVVGSISLMIVHSFVPFPAELLAVANGMVYGAFWGTVITWIGAMLGAFLAFGLARWLGRPFVKRMVPKSRWDRLETWTNRRGGIALLLCRLVPVIAFNLLNYAAGLTTISWWTFAWATGFGILPLTVLMAVMGDRMTELYWWVWMLLAAGIAAAWFALHRGSENSR